MKSLNFCLPDMAGYLKGRMMLCAPSFFSSFTRYLLLAAHRGKILRAGWTSGLALLLQLHIKILDISWYTSWSAWLQQKLDQGTQVQQICSYSDMQINFSPRYIFNLFILLATSHLTLHLHTQLGCKQLFPSSYFI